MPLLHGTLPILGFRVGRFAYLTDVSEIPPDSYALLEDLDVLVLSALRRRPHPTHMNLSRAVLESEKIGAGETYLTHMSHEIHHAPATDELPASVKLAYDGLSLEIAEE